MKAKRITCPSFEPTDEERKLVEQMTSCGIPQESQCLVIRDGIDDKTLRKHFRHEWTKTRMKWSERQEIEHTGDPVWAINNIYEK